MAVFNNYILMKVSLNSRGYGCFKTAKSHAEDVKTYLGMAGISCVYRMILGEKYTFKLYLSELPDGVSLYDILQDLRVEFDAVGDSVSFEMGLFEGVLEVNFGEF